MRILLSGGLTYAALAETIKSLCEKEELSKWQNAKRCRLD